MASNIVIKHRNADSTAPTTSNIIEGELAINMVSQKLYTRDDANNIIELSDGTISANYRPTVSTQTGTAYTIDSDDEQSIVLFTNASAITVTLPSDASDNLPIGYITHIHQDGAGQITLLADGGVTTLAAIGLLTRTQYSSLSVIKTAADTWKVIGDATP